MPIMPLRSCEKQQRKVHRPDLTFAVQDHTVATKPGRDDDTNPSGTAFIKAMREGCRKNGIRLFDIDDPRAGHFPRRGAGTRHRAAGRDARGARQSRQHGRRARRARFRLRHQRARAHPRHASDGAEAAEAHARAARRQAWRACQLEGHRVAAHRRTRRGRRARLCRGICRRRHCARCRSSSA